VTTSTFKFKGPYSRVKGIMEAFKGAEVTCKGCPNSRGGASDVEPFDICVSPLEEC